MLTVSTRAMKPVTLVVLAMLSACAGPAGAQFRTTVVQPDGSYAMPVVLGDQTGLVAAIESAPYEGVIELPSVRPDPVQLNAVIVAWGTGACDDGTALALQRSGPGFRIDIAVNSGFHVACTAQLLVRGLRIQFSEAVSAGAFDVSGGA